MSAAGHFVMVDSGYMGNEQLAWSGRDWRMPVWLWVGLATMFVSALHILSLIHI